jgi:hypothetical protein
MWLERTVEARATSVLLTADWRSIAPAIPPDGFDATFPLDPSYDWAALDNAITAATGQGLKVSLLVTDAPDWAEGPNRPEGVSAGTWKPDPGALADFATALARRYSGQFGGLPEINEWQVWAEPNLSNHLSPQFDGETPIAAEHYRRMLNSFYTAVKSVDVRNQVITAGLAPYGDALGGMRTQPALFWRQLLCVNGRKLRRSCSDSAYFDIASHNPINVMGPTHGALANDDITTPDLGKLRRILEAARKTGGSKPAGRKSLWVTEFWWESDPPKHGGIPLGRHARWLEQGLYLFWKQGVKRALWLQVRDPTPDPINYQTGLFQHDGTPKPAFEAFRFPFVSDRLNRRTVRLWGMAPTPGKVRVQRRTHGGWHTVKRLRARADRVFTGKLKMSKGARLRARADGEISLIWKQH